MARRAATSVFVGRDADLAVLRDALKRVRGEEPAIVLVGGEAGVGKSRLVAEFTGALDGDVRLITGQCVELGEQGLPLAPFAGALREVLRRDGPTAFAGHEDEFARLLPELGALGPPEGPPAAELSRGYLYDLVTTVLAEQAAARSLVLVLEDLHWADRSTRDLLGYLARAARPARLLVIGTYRSDELHRGHPLRAFLAELERVRGVERRELDRLDRDGTAAILADLLGAEPDRTTVDLIHERAQGNPFFVEELAACAGECQLPDSLRDLLLARADRLSESAQGVLRIAAAGGTRVGHRLLAEVAGMPDADLENALREAVVSQVLVSDKGGEYEFRHALVREAAHDDLLPGEQVRLHARYAAAIEADPTLVAAARAPAEIAHHWYAARDHARAITAAVRAAEALCRCYAYAEERRLWERVLELWEQVPDAARHTGHNHLDVLQFTLSAALGAGDHEQAMKLARAALVEVDADAEPHRAAKLLICHGRLMRRLGKSDGGDDLREAYRIASRLAEPGQWAELVTDIAAATALIDRVEGARIAAEVLGKAEHIGDAALPAYARVTLDRCSEDVSGEERLTGLRAAAAAASAAGDLSALTQVLVYTSDLLFEMGRYAEAAEVARGGLSDAARVGITTGAFLLVDYAEALAALGRWDDVEDVCAQAARLDPPGTLALPVLDLRARMGVLRGRAAAAEAVARAITFLANPYLTDYQRLPLLELKVWAARDSGDPAAVVAAASAGLTDRDLVRWPRYAWPLLVEAARTAAVAGDADLTRLVRRRAGEVPVRYPGERAGAAEVAALLAGRDEAPTRWRTAVAARRADGQRHPLARALLGLAEAAAGAGQRAEAAEALLEVGAIAGELDATPLRDEAATLARRAGLRGLGATTAGPDLLTAREREVLRLVSEGHSNSRIAERLFISPKTASVHVSRIIAKLEVTNRGEAAAVGDRLGLRGPPGTPPDDR